MKALILTLSLFIGTSAMASELDNEAGVANQSLQGTVVVRVDNRTQQTAVVQSSALVQNEQAAVALATQSNFVELSKDQVRNELDQDGGASSWYWYAGAYYYSYLNWYGNWYYPAYTYNYGYYTYYYYSNYWYRW